MLQTKARKNVRMLQAQVDSAAFELDITRHCKLPALQWILLLAASAQAL